MKVTFIIQDLFAQGAQYATAMMARGFIARGYEVDLIVSKVHADIEAQGEQRYFDVPYSTNWIYLPHRKARHNIGWLRKYLISTDSVAVVSMCSTYTQAIAIAALGLKRHPSLYTVEHGATFAFHNDGRPKRALNIFDYDWWWNKLYAHIYKGFFAVSSGVARGLTRVCHIPRRKISVVYNPVVDELFCKKAQESPKHPWLINKKCKTFVAAGAYQPYKQHMCLLRAVNKISSTIKMRLIIFGRGPLEAKYKEYISENHLEDVVSIAGYTDNLPAEINASDGFICTTDIESFGIAIVEALACHVPVVSTDAPTGPSEILCDGRYGHLVPVGDIDAISQALVRLAKEPSIVSDDAWRKYELQRIVYRYERAMDLLGMRVEWLSPINRGGYQFFREWVTEAWEKDGGSIIDDYQLPWKMKMLLGKLGVVAPLCRSESLRRLIICVGGRVDYYAWPWCYFYEIVPIIWDCWPKYWDNLVNFVRNNNTKVLFCTSSQTAEYVRKKCPKVKAIWLPEGIKVEAYVMGNVLSSRTIDILEMGRQYAPVHQAIISHRFERPLKHLFQVGDALLFKDFNSMTAGLRDSKIAICYPRCDTHPEMAGNVETLTQRYWECMLSGTLIAGRAPKELIEFCGYNPVVDLCSQPAEQLEEMLLNIDRYQPLVNKNREFAERNAGWDNRIRVIKEGLRI